MPFMQMPHFVNPFEQMTQTTHFAQKQSFNPFGQMFPQFQNMNELHLF